MKVNCTALNLMVQSRSDFNMDNLLQVQRNSEDRKRTTLLELLRSSTYYHINPVNHSSDKKCFAVTMKTATIYQETANLIFNIFYNNKTN
jgi:hypothetical protein